MATKISEARRATRVIIVIIIIIKQQPECHFDLSLTPRNVVTAAARLVASEG
jgi:hypothetical protein